MLKTFGSACEIVSIFSPIGATKLSSDFESACVRNSGKVSALKWQYFASEEEVTTVFPSARPPNSIAKSR